jgi:hypothetical protein
MMIIIIIIIIIMIIIIIIIIIIITIIIIIIIIIVVFVVVGIDAALPAPMLQLMRDTFAKADADFWRQHNYSAHHLGYFPNEAPFHSGYSGYSGDSGGSVDSI